MEQDVKLECEKFKEVMESEDAECRHPDDYCQTRTACIINYIGKERKREQINNKKKTVQD
jgi:hypothetical protein